MIFSKLRILAFALAISMLMIMSSTSTTTHSSPLVATSLATAVATNASSGDSEPEALEWPVKAPTKAQIEEARQCALEVLIKERYGGVSTGNLASKFKPVTACDWAALAAAYASNAGENNPIPPGGKDAFLHAVRLNGAIAFVQPLLGHYFGKISAVKAPLISTQPVVRAEITLAWGGGLQVAIYKIDYRIIVTQGNSNRPVVSGTLKTGKEGKVTEQNSTPIAPDGRISGTIDSKLVQQLGTSLTDLFPIPRFVTQLPCTDNYPDWKVKLTFKDGTVLDLITNRSNIYFAGGPWQTTINKQKYIQYSGKFLEAILDITRALKMPYGTTEAMFCGGIDDPFGDIFGKAEPTAQATQPATPIR